MNMINIHCVVDDKTINYARYMYNSAQKLANQPDNLNLELYTSKSISGSTGHAVGLKDAFASSKLDRINIIVDSDVVFLFKGWDTWLLKTLEIEKVVGATYEDIGGFSSGHGPLQTYKKRPNLVMFAWLSGIDLRSVDPMPNKMDRTLAINNTELSQRYNLPLESQVFLDVGWRIPAILDSMGIMGLGFQNIRFNTLNGFENIHESCELFTLADGSLFAAHQRGSSRSLFRVDKISRAFYTACDELLSKS
jgi:hypothetical protein